MSREAARNLAAEIHDRRHKDGINCKCAWNVASKRYSTRPEPRRKPSHDNLRFMMSWAHVAKATEGEGIFGNGIWFGTDLQGIG